MSFWSTNYWEDLHKDAGLSPTNAADAFLDVDADGLINLHEYWANCNPMIPDGSNTVLSIMARSIDERLSTNSMGRIDKFKVYNSIPNTNCWANSVNTTCASAYNTYWGRYRAGTAISSRHVALANHYAIPNGYSISFMTIDGTLITRRILDGARVLQTDIYILLLDEPLPDTITPASILPECYADYIRTGKGLPVLMFDFDEHAIVNELDALPTTKGSVNGFRPESPIWRLYFLILVRILNWRKIYEAF